MEVNEESGVLSADCMVCWRDDLHLSVERCAEMPEERKDFHRAILGAPRNVIMGPGQGVFSCLL